MSSKVSRLFQKWPCFGGKTPREEVEETTLRLNQPKIVITECKSVGSSPNISRKSSSSSSSSSASYDETKTEVILNTDGKTHEMGMSVVLKTRECSGDRVDGEEKRDVTSMISVSDVAIGSFAHGFGVRKGDMISRINGKECVKVQEIKEAFLSKKSDQLLMEILRKTKSRETGRTELIKMTVSNSTRIGGNTENELEIIQVEMGSSWTLSDNETFFHQDLVDTIMLQFASVDTAWVVKDGNRLALANHLPANEVVQAKFYVHKYWSMSFSSETGFTVVIQHAHSGLCVAFDHESIYLVDVPDLETITGNKPFLFNMHTEQAEGSGMNMTFQSILDTSRYLGFHRHESTAAPIHVVQNSGNAYGNQHEEIVFIVTYQ